MQANPQLPTTPPLSGADAVSDMNDALKTLATDFSGDVDPAAYAWPYSRWADTANGLIKRRNAAGSGWVVEGRLLARPQQQYDQGSEPTTDEGDIWINGIGPCRWDSTDSKYYRAFFTTKQVFTESGTFTPDAYTKRVRISGTGGGGGGSGGAGFVPGYVINGAGGGAGQSVMNQIITVTPQADIVVTMGAGGAGSAGGAAGNGTGVGGGGGTTWFGGFVTLLGGAGGGAANSSNVGSHGGAGYPAGGDGSGASGIPAGLVLYLPTGAGASSPFGAGGASVRGASSVSFPGTNGSGYGSGGSGGACTTGSGSGGAGGNGAPGILIVEY